MSKKSRLRGCVDKQYGKDAQAILKSASEQNYHIHRSLATKLCFRKFLLFTCEILGLLFNTLATAEKYAVLNREKRTTPIQMQLSEKQKTFTGFFAAFSKSK